MSKITLVFPNEDLETKAFDFKHEFYNNGEKTIYGSYKFDVDKYSYQEWLEIIRNNLDKDKYNPKFGLSHTLFAINEEGKIVGIVNLRHSITEFYQDSGQIGYSVRPSERQKGYATEILKKTLELARNQGLEEVYIVCKQNNVPSRKTIIRNNGILNRVFEKEMIIYEEYKIIVK